MSTESLATGPTSIDERDSARLYRVLTDVESDERLSGVYRRLAETEEKHLRFWEERLRKAGEAVSEPRVRWRARELDWLAGRFGTWFVLPTIDAMKQAEEIIRKGLQTATSEAYQGESLRRSSSMDRGMSLLQAKRNASVLGEL